MTECLHLQPHLPSVKELGSSIPGTLSHTVSRHPETPSPWKAGETLSSSPSGSLCSQLEASCFCLFLGLGRLCFRRRASLSPPVLTRPPNKAGSSHLCGSALPARLPDPSCAELASFYTLIVSTSWRLQAALGQSNQKAPMVPAHRGVAVQSQGG